MVHGFHKRKGVLYSKMSRCFILKEAHWEVARRCAKKYKLINFPKVICSTILASSLTLFTQEEQQSNMLFVYFNASLSIVVAILTTSSSFLDYNVQKARHRSSSLGYGKLAVYIDRVLRLPPDERESFGETLSKVNEEYASLRTEAPFLKTSVVIKYDKIYRPEHYKDKDKDKDSDDINIISSIMQTDNTYHPAFCDNKCKRKSMLGDILKKSKKSLRPSRYEINEPMTQEKNFDRILYPLIGPKMNSLRTYNIRPPPPSPTNNNKDLQFSPRSPAKLDKFFSRTQSRIQSRTQSRTPSPSQPYSSQRTTPSPSPPYSPQRTTPLPEQPRSLTCHSLTQHTLLSSNHPRSPPKLFSNSQSPSPPHSRSPSPSVNL